MRVLQQTLWILVMVAGLVIMIAALAVVYDTYDFKSKATKVNATVLSLSFIGLTGNEGDSRMSRYNARLRFAAPGRQYEFNGEIVSALSTEPLFNACAGWVSFGGPPPVWRKPLPKVGETVPALYDPAHPEKARLDEGSCSWYGPAVLVIGSTVLLLVRFGKLTTIPEENRLLHYG